MSTRIVFVLGGARSGKSRFACELAVRSGKEVTYIATCFPSDEEMVLKIEEHKKRRPPDWLTVEEGEDLLVALSRVGEREVVIVDCLTLFVSNLLLKEVEREDIFKNLEDFIQKATDLKKWLILVSNEVGMGIVPDNRLARQFREIAGKINQVVAEVSDEVYFLVAARPIKIK